MRIAVLLFVLAAVTIPAVLTTKSRLKKRRIGRVFATKYLIRFGYLSPTSKRGRFYRNALCNFQRFSCLPVTCKLDKATKRQMTKMRCGEPDKRPKYAAKKAKGNKRKKNRSRSRPVYVRGKARKTKKSRKKTTHGRRKRFVLSGPSWRKRSLKYFLRYQTSSSLTKLQQNALMAKALKFWSDVTPLTFNKVSSETRADIKISFPTGDHGDGFPFDGSGGIVAHAADPEDGRVHFDGDENFTNGTSRGVNLLFVAVHEFGHTLGLDHSNVQDAVMYPFYRPYSPNMTLHADDIAGIQQIYGGPGSTVCKDIDDICQYYVQYCTDPEEITLREDCPQTCNLC